jgi:predicted DNA binding CopG/RHH family protein
MNKKAPKAALPKLRKQLRETRVAELSAPKFANEDEEARWWASDDRRKFVKAQAATRTARQEKGSTLVSGLSHTGSVQIALRLPAPDLAKAREIAERKGIGYQTLLKMLVHEGLRREARR